VRPRLQRGAFGGSFLRRRSVKAFANTSSGSPPVRKSRAGLLGRTALPSPGNGTSSRRRCAANTRSYRILPGSAATAMITTSPGGRGRRGGGARQRAPAATSARSGCGGPPSARCREGDYLPGIAGDRRALIRQRQSRRRGVHQHRVLELRQPPYEGSRARYAPPPGGASGRRVVRRPSRLVRPARSGTRTTAGRRTEQKETQQQRQQRQNRQQQNREQEPKKASQKELLVDPGIRDIRT